MNIVLTIAGFDNTAGAGIQADLKTISALGCYASTILTSLAIQNTQGVKKIYSISKDCFEDQINAVLDDLDIKSVKIGQINDESVVDVLAKYLPSISAPIVCDPVIRSSSGFQFLSYCALKKFQTTILPLCSVITPNTSEAEILLGVKDLTSSDEIEKACLVLGKEMQSAVVITGGDSQKSRKQSYDCVFDGKEVFWINMQRIHSKNLHGTGCTFSSAIASFLSHGLSMKESILRAKRYTHQAIKFAKDLKIGKDKGALHHFFNNSFKVGN